MAVADITYYPQITDEDRLLAKTTVEGILRSGSFRLEANGTTFVVPKGTMQQIVDILSLTADGQPSDVYPLLSELTVSQAANFLKISDQRMEKLLDAGFIAFREEDGNRMIESNSLFEYDRRKKLARLAMRQMTCEAQEMGLYDD